MPIDDSRLQKSPQAWRHAAVADCLLLLIRDRPGVTRAKGMLACPAYLRLAVRVFGEAANLGDALEVIANWSPAHEISLMLSADSGASLGATPSCGQRSRTCPSGGISSCWI